MNPHAPAASVDDQDRLIARVVAQVLQTLRGEAIVDDIVRDHDRPQPSDRVTAVLRQLARRGIAGGTARIHLSDRPAAATWELIRDGRRAAMIQSINDVDRFALELHPTDWVIDMRRTNLIAATNIAARILQSSRHPRGVAS